MCPYCNNLNKAHATEYPYPYFRFAKVGKENKLMMQIHKINCQCGKPYYISIRHGFDMGLDNKYYRQVYKYGMYIYQYNKEPLEEVAE